MVSKAAVIRQAVLLSGAISVFPLILYPSTLNIPKFPMHPLYVFVEWLLYFLIYLAALPKLSVPRKFIAGGVTVLYRLAIGFIFGILVSLMQGLPFFPTIGYCLWEYSPALALHVIFAPFLLRPLYNRVWERGVRFAIDSGRPRTTHHPSSGFSFAESSTVASATRPGMEPGDISFDTATSWVGEYSGVRMSLLVSNDGLVVSRWARQVYSQDAEFWAAVAVEMVRFHHRWPTVAEPVNLRRLEVETDSGRLLVRQAGEFWLVVLTEADAGDLVSVRLIQAVEMIEKHYQDRYRAVRSAGLEVSHA